MNAEIITVGTELLLGQITDTNSTYLSEQLARMGIDVFFRQTVGDNLRRMTSAIRRALGRADIVILTGGLGPTADDVTRIAIAEAVEAPLVLDQECLQDLKQWFDRIGHEMTENNRSQAYRPRGAEFLPNELGSAPGIWTESDQGLVIALPGPPGEMRTMFRKCVVPRLRQNWQGGAAVLVHRILKVVGLGESRTEDRIEDIIAGQTNPTIAPYAKGGEVQLRITAKAATEAEAGELIRPVEQRLRSRLGDHIYGADSDRLEGVVGELLRQQGLTLAVAESCTGGLIGHRLTQIPGSSDYFLSDIVAYSNAAKQRLLAVNAETLAAHGAVSAETAREMAEGAATQAGADCSVATTGIAGPTGGTPEKPVGTVWFGVYSPLGLEAHHRRFHGGRRFVKRRTAQHALILLRRALLKLQDKQPRA